MSTTPPTAGGGYRTPDAVLAEAVAQLHEVLDVIAAIDPAEVTGYGLGEQVAELFTARRRVEGAAGVFGHRFAGTDEWIDYRKPEHWLGAQVSDSHASIRAHAREWSCERAEGPAWQVPLPA